MKFPLTRRSLQFAPTGPGHTALPLWAADSPPVRNESAIMLRPSRAVDGYFNDGWLG